MRTETCRQSVLHPSVRPSVRRAVMRLLAIDTALDGLRRRRVRHRGRQDAGEREPDHGARPRRGADAADRPRDGQGGHRVLRARSHRRDGRSRQSSPDCASAFRRRAASRWRPASRRSALPRSRPMRRPISPTRMAAQIVAAIDARHAQRLPAGVRQRRPHPGGAAASRRSRTRCARRATGPVRIVGSGAALIAAAWPAGEPPPLLVDPGRAGHRMGRPARRGGAQDRRRADAALSARARRAAAGRRTVAAAMMGFLTRLFARGEPTLSEAGPRDAAAFAPLHAASFRRGWSEDEVERLLLDPPGGRAPRHAAAESSPASSCRAWPPARRKSSRSRWRRGGADAASRGGCSIFTCGVSPASAFRTVFLEVEESNRPALRLYDRRRASVRWDGAPATTRRTAGPGLAALVLRRDLA